MRLLCPSLLLLIGPTSVAASGAAETHRCRTSPCQMMFVHPSKLMHHTSSRKKFIHRPSTGLALRRRSLQRLYNQSTKHSHGSVTHRSEGATHLDLIEDAVDSVLLHYEQHVDMMQSKNVQSNIQSNNILNLPPNEREAIGVAINIQKRLRGLANSGDCRRCWLQKRHCVCGECIPLEGDDNDVSFDEVNVDVSVTKRRRKGIPNVNRLFLLVSC